MKRKLKKTCITERKHSRIRITPLCSTVTTLYPYLIHRKDSPVLQIRGHNRSVAATRQMKTRQSRLCRNGWVESRSCITRMYVYSVKDSVQYCSRYSCAKGKLLILSGFEKLTQGKFRSTLRGDRRNLFIRRWGISKGLEAAE